MRTFVLTLTLLAAACAAHAQQWPLQGQSCAVSEKKTVVVKSDKDWQAVWKQAHSSDEPAPKVDFNREMVVGVFLGEKQTAGYKIDVVVMPAPGDKNSVVVFYREVPPAGFSAQVVTRPYVLLKIEAGKRVTFEVNQRFAPLPGEGKPDAKPSLSPERRKWIEGAVRKDFSFSFDGGQ